MLCRRSSWEQAKQIFSRTASVLKLSIFLAADTLSPVELKQKPFKFNHLMHSASYLIEFLSLYIITEISSLGQRFHGSGFKVIFMVAQPVDSGLGHSFLWRIKTYVRTIFIRRAFPPTQIYIWWYSSSSCLLKHSCAFVGMYKKPKIITEYCMSLKGGKAGKRWVAKWLANNC